MKTKLINILKYIILFFIGGCIYYGIEMMWRGHSHWTMFIIGGLAFIFCGGLNESNKYKIPLLYQILIGGIGITLLEFITGLIVNIGLGWNIWDYSKTLLNILGQICLPFTIIWFVLALIAIIIDDILRYLLFKEPIPQYQIK